MNTLFVILVWSAFYYLFFTPLTPQEWLEYAKFETEAAENGV